VSGLICIWDITSGSCVRVLTSHKGAVNCMAWAQDDTRILVSGGDDGNVFVWENNADMKASLSTIAESPSVDQLLERSQEIRRTDSKADALAKSRKDIDSVRAVDVDDVVIIHNSQSPTDLNLSAPELKQEDKGPVLMSSLFDLSEAHENPEEKKNEASYKKAADDLQQQLQFMDVEYRVSTTHMQNLVEQSEDLATSLAGRNKELEEINRRFIILQDTLQVLFIGFCKVILGVCAAKMIYELRHRPVFSVFSYLLMAVLYYVIVKFLGLEYIQDKIVEVVLPKLKKSPQPALLAFAIYDRVARLLTSSLTTAPPASAVKVALALPIVIVPFAASANVPITPACPCCGTVAPLTLIISPRAILERIPSVSPRALASAA
jgi:hypothetical protein